MKPFDLIRDLMPWRNKVVAAPKVDIKILELAEATGTAEAVGEFIDQTYDDLKISVNTYDNIPIGETVAVLFSGDERHIGIARYNPDDRNPFSEERGKQIALGRAFFQMAISKDLTKKRDGEKSQKPRWPKSLSIVSVAAMDEEEMRSFCEHVSGMLSCNIYPDLLIRDAVGLVENNVSQQSAG